MINVTETVTENSDAAEILILRSRLDQLRQDNNDLRFNLLRAEAARDLRSREADELRADNAALIRLIEKKDEENREMARALSAVKAGKRPRDLAKKGYFAADPA